jgi:hypothetical protein
MLQDWSYFHVTLMAIPYDERCDCHVYLILIFKTTAAASVNAVIFFNCGRVVWWWKE